MHWGLKALVVMVGLQSAEAAAGRKLELKSPKAARTVTLAYDIGVADLYYGEMIVEKSADGSSFMMCAWENGYFGLQQFDGDHKRTVNFVVWNGPDAGALDPLSKVEPVETLYAEGGGKTNRFKPEKTGVQFLRQLDWRVGETNRFVVDAQVTGLKTTYTGWIQNSATGDWLKLATMRARSGGSWLRGYSSFIEDFRRDTNSVADVRMARFSNLWAHEFKGPYNPVKKAMFTTGNSPYEPWESMNAAESAGSLILATGGNTEKKAKIGDWLKFEEAPFRKPAAPDLPFINLTKSEP